MEWAAYFELEPFGAYRDNMHAGMVTAMLYNVNRPKNAKARSFVDFMLIPQDKDQDRKARNMKAIATLRALAKPTSKVRKKPRG